MIGEHGGKDKASEGNDEIIDFEEAIRRIGTGRAQYLLLLLTAGGYLATCTEMLMFVFVRDCICKSWQLSDDMFSWLPFTTSGAGVVGSLLFGIWSDKKGRQVPFITSVGICAMFGVASAFAPQFWSFILIRSFVSFGLGGIVAVDFVLFLEFLPIKNRGKMMVVITLSGAVGVAYTAGVAWLLIPGNHWRLFIIVCAAPICLVFLLRLIVSVESPRFLFATGKHDMAVKVLMKIARQNNRKDALAAVTIAFEQEEKSRNCYDLFSKEFALLTLQFSALWFLQATGYWGVTIFFPEYLSKLHIDPYFDMFINVCAQIPGMFLVTQMIDSHVFGRIWTLRIFIAGPMVMLFLASFLQDKVSSAVLAVITYFFMPPIYSILSTYTPEMYPTLLRSAAMSWMNIAAAIPSMVSAFIGAKLISAHQKWLYPLIWGCVFLLQLITALTLKRETASKPVKENQTVSGHNPLISSEIIIN